MQYSIRRYEVAADHMDDFVDAWQTGVLPLRQKFGFTIVGAFAVRASNEFVWILGYDGPGTFAEADGRYYASAERDSVDPDPAQFLVAVSELDAVRVY